MKAPEEDKVGAAWSGDFPAVAPGWYLTESVEGIKMYTKPDDDEAKPKFQIPVSIVSGPVKSDEDGNFNGQYITAFLPTDGKMTPDKAWNLIWAFDLSDKFLEKFEDYDDMESVVKSAPEKLLKFMQMKMVGKSAYVEVTHQVDKKTKKTWVSFNRAFKIDRFKSDILPTLEASDGDKPKSDSEDWD